VKRSYHQFCGVARALDLVGERWTLLIARDLLLGPRRYGDLLAGLPGITTNLLALRLKELRANGLVQRTEQRGVVGYELTALGRELEPILMALGRFGFHFMQGPKKDDKLDVGWALLSSKRRYTGAAEATIELVFGERHFQVRARKDYVDVKEGTPWEAEARVFVSPEAFRGILYGGESSDEHEKSGRLRIEGSRDAWQRYQAAFGMRVGKHGAKQRGSLERER